jgi:hypothetical protein
MNHEEALRRTLEAEAGRVEIRPDALTEIRTRIRGRTRRRTGWAVALGGGLAAATASGLAAAVLVPGSAEPPTPAPPVGSAATAPAPSAAGTPPPSRDPGAVVGPARSTPAVERRVSLAVYYVGTVRSAEPAGEATEAPEAGGAGEGTGTQPRLYREFHRLPAGDGSPAARVRAAVAAMLGRPPADPDYASAWPAGARVRDTGVAAGAVTVDLSGAERALAAAPDAEHARVAVQELVWTATAAAGVPDVRLLFDGRPVDLLFGHVPADGLLNRAPLVDVLAPVWLISPRHGATVGGTVRVHVAGAVFEATAHLRVRRGEEVVVERVLTLDAGAPEQGETELTLTLPPGEYVFEAYEPSPVDGAPRYLDDHTVTVR